MPFCSCRPSKVHLVRLLEDGTGILRCETCGDLTHAMRMASPMPAPGAEDVDHVDQVGDLVPVETPRDRLRRLRSRRGHSL